MLVFDVAASVASPQAEVQNPENHASDPHESAIQPADESDDSFQENCSETSSINAASNDADVDPATENTEVKVEALSDEEAAEEAADISALSHTTSAHDDWLHRGPFLYDMDFHTYVTYVNREPRAVRARVTDMERQQDIFLFDAHYALADSYVQTLDTQGQCKLVVLEA